MTRTVSALMALLLFAAAGCNKYHDKVIGTWDSDLPMSPRFTFNKDGTGEMSVPSVPLAPRQSFTWRLNGSNLIFTLGGKDSGFLIKSADEQKMHVNDPAEKGKQDFTFTRVKG